MKPVYNVRACHRVGDLSRGISLALCASAHKGGIDAWCACTGRANESCSCLCVHVNMCFVSTFKLIQMRSDQLGCSASSTVTSLCFTKHQILLPAIQGCFEFLPWKTVLTHSRWYANPRDISFPVYNQYDEHRREVKDDTLIVSKACYSALSLHLHKSKRASQKRNNKHPLQYPEGCPGQ